MVASSIESISYFPTKKTLVSLGSNFSSDEVSSPPLVAIIIIIITSITITTIAPIIKKSLPFFFEPSDTSPGPLVKGT